VHEFLIDMLECPACHGALWWEIIARDGDRIDEGKARCTPCDGVYPIKEGIGVFLTPDLPRHDLWEQTESGLVRHLRDHPKLERQLMDAPLETLNPADQFFRAMVLEERGDYSAARSASREAFHRLYTREYLACYRRQIEVVVERLSTYQGPIVDLASGRGALVEILAERLDNPIVMTDFSPTVLQRNRRVLEFLRLHERVSLLAFDARRTPFKIDSIAMMTSNLGLGNIEEPANLLSELRRVVNGELLAITHFYSEADNAHRDALQGSDLLYRESTVGQFRASGWNVTAANTCHGRAEPTPQGIVLEGFAIDGLPIAGTTLEWCVLVAR
jgi:uncharacterized protein YbaR (Trm112 family)